MNAPGHGLSGGDAAKKGLPLTWNPHPSGSAEYYRWHADWHWQCARLAAQQGKLQIAAKFEEVGDEYRGKAANIELRLVRAL